VLVVKDSFSYVCFPLKGNICMVSVTGGKTFAMH
jgi:hypothetical protein